MVQRLITFYITVLYTNLVFFIVICKYIHIKQQSNAKSIRQCLTQMQQNRYKASVWNKNGSTLWHRFIDQNIRYTCLIDELHDYNQFWTNYLTFIFIFNVALIGLILYIIIVTNIMFLVKFTYAIVLYVNCSILLVIIYYGGRIVLQNSTLSNNFTYLLGSFVHAKVQLPIYQTIKVSCL